MSDSLERDIVAGLCRHLALYGFNVTGVYDGEELVKFDNAEDAMELIFQFGEPCLYFQKPEFGEHEVLLVVGNGVDIISDWRHYWDDRDGFRVAMESFDAEEYTHDPIHQEN